MANSTFFLGISALTAAFAIITLSFGPVAAAENIISANEAYDLSVKNQLMVIDIRSPKEWAESGLPRGARTITMHNPQGKKAFLEAIRDVVAEDTAHPIALICAVGGRPRGAQRFLAENGFSNVSDISEGMFGCGKGKPGWLKRNLPTQPCPIADHTTATICLSR